MKKSQAKNTVAKSASIITLLSVFERSLGFIYRIVLSRLIGAEGVGIYQVSLSLFALFLTVGTGGIPITLSRFIAKNKAENNPLEERRNIGAGIVLSLLFTLPILLILLPFADKIPFLFSDSRCVPVFQILLSGLVFCALFAVLRGAFWGNKNFFLPALIELAEETVMVIFGILLLRGVSSPLTGATLAGVAVVISYLFSFTVSAICFFCCGGRFSAPKKQLKHLFNATLPITCVRGAGALVSSAIAVLLPAMLLKTGVSHSEALKVFGVASGMAIPVLFIPSTIVGSLALVLVPELSGDYHRQNRRRLFNNIERGLRFSILLSLFLLPFFFVLGEKLGALAFSNALAGEYIKKGCWVLLPMSVSMISTSALNSIGFEKQTFLFYFVGAGGALLCILLLPALLGAYAYIVALGVSFTLNSLCNLLLLGKKCDGFYRRAGKRLLKISLIALGLCLPLCGYGSLCVSLFSKLFSPFLSLACATLCLGIFALLCYLLCGLISVKKIFRRRKKKE